MADAPDTKVVLQAHALRTRDTRQALVHGGQPPRMAHSAYGALIAGTVLAIVVVIAIFVVARVATALHK